jgi:sugar phosphate isomerase/epimerase
LDIGDLRMPAKEAIRAAAELALTAIEIPSVEGELAPENLSSTGRRHLSRLVRGFGLSIAALRADLPGAHFTDPAGAELRIDRTRDILRLAADLGVSTVTAGVGALTHPTSGEASEAAMQALAQIGEYADSCGVSFSIRPGEDSVEALAEIMDRLRCPAIKFALDPAAMVMAGRNPLSLVARFHDRLSLLHARDGTAGGAGGTGSETRFGEGDVEWAGLFAGLGAAGFCGACILRRTDSQTPVEDIAIARDAIGRYVRPMQHDRSGR